MVLAAQMTTHLTPWRRPLLAAAFVLACGPAEAADRKPLIGDHVHLTAAFPGCLSADDEMQMVMLFAKKDEEAGMAVYREHASSCATFKANIMGDVEDVSFVKDLACVRPKGKPSCYWLPTEVLSR